MRERSQIVCVQEIPLRCVSLICVDTATIVRVGCRIHVPNWDGSAVFINVDHGGEEVLYVLAACKSIL